MENQSGVNRGSLPTYEESTNQYEMKHSVHFNTQVPSYIPPPPPPIGFQHPNVSGAYYQPHVEYPHHTGPAIVQVTAVPEQQPQTIIYKIKNNRRVCCSAFFSLIVLIICIVVIVKVFIPAINRISAAHDYP